MVESPASELDRATSRGIGWDHLLSGNDNDIRTVCALLSSFVVGGSRTYMSCSEKSVNGCHDEKSSLIQRRALCLKAGGDSSRANNWLTI